MPVPLNRPVLKPKPKLRKSSEDPSFENSQSQGNETNEKEAEQFSYQLAKTLFETKTRPVSESVSLENTKKKLNRESLREKVQIFEKGGIIEFQTKKNSRRKNFF